MFKKVILGSILSASLILGACGTIDSADSLVDKFEDQGIVMNENKLNTYFKIGMEGSQEYSFKLDNNDEVLLFVFAKDKDVSYAMEQFEKQFKMSKLEYKPTFYFKENTLIVHLSISKNEKISNGFEKVLKDYNTVSVKK